MEGDVNIAWLTKQQISVTTDATRYWMILAFSLSNYGHRYPQRLTIVNMNGTDQNSPLSASAENSTLHHGFKITTRKFPILKAEPIELMTAQLGISPPEMIFGDNMVLIEHLLSRWSINFNSFDALDRVDKTGDSMLQVAHTKEWQSTRYERLERLERILHAEKR